MRKIFLVTVAILSCSVVFAREPEKVAVLSSKVILENTSGYAVLSDGSCWKVMAFSKRWRSPSEWWNNVQLAPKEYDCLPSDWYLGSQIAVYQKYGNLEVNEADATNQDELKQCTHLFANTRTGQVLFAISLDPADCIVRLFNEAQEEGYKKGYVKGRSSAYQNSAEIYDSGYSEGYKVGYSEGCLDSLRRE